MTTVQINHRSFIALLNDESIKNPEVIYNTLISDL